MKEISAELRRWLARGDEQAALATVVATRRSAPRPVGSTLAVSERGELAGPVSGPTGLDLGAETPAETAVSILAEIFAVRSGRSGGRLKDATGRIHAELQSK
jgi:xanthine dehydrogenase accessory factor